MKRDNIIEEIEERDLIQIQRIQHEVFKRNTTYENLKKFYETTKENKDIHVLGYYIEDNLVGTVTLNIVTIASGKEAMIWNLGIMEEYRRFGIATKLMNKAEEIAKNKNIPRIWLVSGFQRKGAHELYRKLGYDENTYKVFEKNISLN